MSSKNRTMYTTCTEELMPRKELSLEIVRGLHGLARARKPRRLTTFCFLVLLIAPFFTSFIFQGTSMSQMHSFSTAAEPPVLILTYYSRTNTTPESLESGNRISGDHIILNATWLPEDNVNGTEIVVNAAAIPSIIKATSINNTVEIDTRLLGNNATCTLNVTTWLLNGTSISEFFTDIFLGNFFAPSVRVISPNGGEI